MLWGTQNFVNASRTEILCSRQLTCAFQLECIREKSHLVWLAISTLATPFPPLNSVIESQRYVMKCEEPQFSVHSMSRVQAQAQRVLPPEPPSDRGLEQP